MFICGSLSDCVADAMPDAQPAPQVHLGGPPTDTLAAAKQLWQNGNIDEQTYRMLEAVHARKKELLKQKGALNGAQQKKASSKPFVDLSNGAPLRALNKATSRATSFIHGEDATQEVFPSKADHLSFKYVNRLLHGEENNTSFHEECKGGHGGGKGCKDGGVGGGEGGGEASAARPSRKRRSPMKESPSQPAQSCMDEANKEKKNEKTKRARHDQQQDHGPVRNVEVTSPLSPLVDSPYTQAASSEDVNSSQELCSPGLTNGQRQNGNNDQRHTTHKAPPSARKPEHWEYSDDKFADAAAKLKELREAQRVMELREAKVGGAVVGV
jgi:hypothetical protein